MNADVPSSSLPAWSYEWLSSVFLAGQVFAIALAAWVIQRTLRRILLAAGTRYDLPAHLVKPAVAITRWIIIVVATILVLGRLGVSGTVLWTAMTGFAAVAAVAFFAAWSVLSNLFCAILIFTARPFRLGDQIELLDTAEKPGARGEVVDISLLYVTLLDSSAERPGALLQIPNALIFQRVVRRWKGGMPSRFPAGGKRNGHRARSGATTGGDERQDKRLTRRRARRAESSNARLLRRP